MIPFVKTTASNIVGWIREAATAVNRLIGDSAALEARVTVAEAAATAIDGRAGALEGRMDAAEANIAALQAPAAIALTPSAAPASPAEGTVYYDAAAHKLTVWDGSVWQSCW